MADLMEIRWPTLAFPVHRGEDRLGDCYELRPNQYAQDPICLELEYEVLLLSAPQARRLATALITAAEAVEKAGEPTGELT